MIENPGGAVIAISSHVMRGSVGNRAIVFALETLGFGAWSVPTIVLPYHPGHGRSTPLRFDDTAFALALEALGKSRWTGEVRGIVSGYLATPQQAKAIAALVNRLRADKPDLPYLCDPVIGDEKGLYVAEETASAIRDTLIPLATIATPNRFELGWLTGSTTDDNTVLMKAALTLGPAEVAVTSAHAMLKEGVAALYVNEKHALLAEHAHIENPPNGLGDLFSALFLAARLENIPPEEALEKTTASVFSVLSHARRNGSDELLLEQNTASLRAPLAKVGIRQLMHPSRRRKRI